jgi:putative membrane protein
MNREKHNIVAIFLFVGYIVLFVILGIRPYARDVWFVENMAIVPVVVLLAVMYVKGSRFSTPAYVLMAFLIFLHTIGGHYTFERVPFDFVNHLFGWQRNNYDRVAHTTVGFFAFAIAEFVETRRYVNNKWMALFFAVFSIMALAAAYEIFEWQYAIAGDPKAGIAVLGSQGDTWDAQKDMLCDTMGALFGGILYLFIGRKHAVHQ